MSRKNLKSFNFNSNRTPLFIKEQDKDYVSKDNTTEPLDPKMVNSETEPKSNVKPEKILEGHLIIPVKYLTEVSEDFKQAITKGLIEVPDTIRTILKDNDLEILVSHSIDEVHETKDPIAHLTSSSYLKDSNKIVLVETVDGPKGDQIPSLNPLGLLCHSLGHAFDSLAPKYTSKEHLHNLFSDLEAFRYAHVSDIGRLSQDKKKLLSIYVEDGDYARSECFAECFAALHGVGSVYTIDVMNSVFPAVMKQIKDIINSVTKDSNEISQ